MSKRLLRINELLGQEISKIFSKEIEIPEGSLITIAKVEVSSDLKEAKVWISIYPFEKKGKIFNILRKSRWNIQFLLNRRLEMYPVPKINFKIDTTEEEAGKIEEILNKLDETNSA